MNTKIATILLLLSLSLSVNAQYRKLQNLPYTDRRIFHLGFTIGLNAQDLILTHSGNINDNGEMWFAEIPKYSPGFAVGLIGDIYISNYLNFRILPTLHLGDKLFIFKEQISGKEFSTRIRNNYISIRGQIKI